MPPSPGAAWWRGVWMSEEPERDAALLVALGAGGVEIRDAETYFEGETAFERRQGPGAELIAFFEIEPSRWETIREELRSFSDHAQRTLLGLAPFEDESWRTAWRAYFHPRLLTPRARVGPPWAEFEAPEGGVRLVIEPGMAFGTGTHETTALAAELLDEQIAAGARGPLLDVGSGSGVLSILGVLLGAQSARGIDISPDAAPNARRNAELNGLDSDRARFDELSLAAICEREAPYSIVVANILAPILIRLAPELRRAIAPGGALIVSGIIDTALEEARRAFGEAGLAWVETRARGAWRAGLLAPQGPER